MAWALAACVSAAWDLPAWQNLAGEPQTLKAMGLSAWTGLASAALSLGIAAHLLSRSFPGPIWTRLVKVLGPMLAVPHVAFAVGFVALIAPSGWLVRAVSPWATGFSLPPAWATTQDQWGLGIIAVLVCKEVPFLLWTAATQLQRADVAGRLAQELDVARSLGYTPNVAWRKLVWPQLWPRLRWPLLAVLAYGLTVVDVAIIIGPTSPPTVAVLAWTWLQDADPAQNAQGAAAAWVLALLLAGLALLLWQLPTLALWRKRLTNGVRGRTTGRRLGHHPLGGRDLLLGRGGQRDDGTPPARRFFALPLPVPLASWPSLVEEKTFMLWGMLRPKNMNLGLLAGLAVYAAVLAALLAGSVSGVWTFPALWPQTLTWGAWRSVFDSLPTVGTTLGLALASSTTALLWSVAWLECAPSAWDAALRRLVYLPLVLPSVLWIVGVHALTLAWGLDARWPGVWLAHSLATLPYVLIALSGAYLEFDPRYAFITASLGKSRWMFLSRVKWPLLKAALASSLAVGFAVSVAQYLPTLYIGAGRFATVTTEAVTLASGAQRSLTSAYAALQWLLPVIGFGLAAWVGRPRRFSLKRTRSTSI